MAGGAGYGDGGESRDSCHCSFSARWQGLFLLAGLNSHDCIQGTLVAERCSSSEEAQSRTLGREGSREPRIPPQNPALMPSALKGNFAMILTKSVTPDSVWDSQPHKVHYNSLSLSLCSVTVSKPWIFLLEGNHINVPRPQGARHTTGWLMLQNLSIWRLGVWDLLLGGVVSQGPRENGCPSAINKQSLTSLGLGCISVPTVPFAPWTKMWCAWYHGILTSN